MKVWPYVAQCVQTGTLFLGIMDSLDRRSVIGALQRLAYSVGVEPTMVTTDASHSFTQKTWNPECQDGYSTKDLKVIDKKFSNYEKTKRSTTKKLRRSAKQSETTIRVDIGVSFL